MKNRISIDPSAPDSLLTGAKIINENFDQIDSKLDQIDSKIEQFDTVARSEIAYLHWRAGINEKNILEITLELETLKGAILNGLTNNIYIESFIDIEDVTLLNGATKHDSTNKKVYLA
ncbi:hypothetical protein FB479_101602 [Brevibacillus sp. AG162]|uniref:hypothetical protein n=1 Tax=Brevibacillus sp. AG162 TaxID=2572910 RepID=UPI0011534F6C|nr:hypothetical protein [Brevibacillus sp. AG162]TQK74990.1 hypothetical protein FB479_101602 [Brevibacillus sp. AG162]